MILEYVFLVYMLGPTGLTAKAHAYPTFQACAEAKQLVTATVAAQLEATNTAIGVCRSRPRR